MAKKIKYLFEGVVNGKVYARAWRDGRNEIAVQVWKSGKPEGEPDGDWAVPKCLGLDLAIKQAIAQTN